MTEYVYYRELFEIFKAYTTPKLIKVLESQNIKYLIDAKGKPFTTRATIEDVLGENAET
jgi:predicted flavoprotein YhiN